MLSTFFDRITRLSLKFRWITIILTAVILALGVYSATRLNLEMLPRVEFPQTIVIAQWPDGESSADLLEQITIPLEEKLAPIDGVVNVESTTNKGFAVVIVRYDFGLDQERILADIETAVAAANLPETADTTVLNFSLSDLPIVVASVSSANLPLADLKTLVETELQPQLAALNDVSEVQIGGGQELPEEVVVEETPEEDEVDEDPGRLPITVIQGAKVLDIEIEYAQEITVDLLRGLSGYENAAQQVLLVLNLLPEDLLIYIQPEALSYLPQEFLAGLEPELVAELDMIAADFGGVGQYTADEAVAALSGEELVAKVEPTVAPTVAPEPEPVAELPSPDPVPLPETWILGAAQLSQVITDTGDILPEFMQGIIGLAPEQLAELTPEMWRAFDPAVTAVALPAVAETLDAELLAQLNAIQNAASGIEPDAVELPDSWKATAAASGFPITTTADIPAEAFGLLANVAPELLADLTPEILLALPAEKLAALPEPFIAELDPALQQTVANVIVADARFVLETAVAEGEPIEEPEPVDPGRLPDLLIQGAAQAGQTIENAQDITPEFVRLFNALGAQGIQALQLLTPDNLRLLQPEVIGLLPVEFLDTLPTDLRAELDELAAEFGGAGALAIAEAEEAAAQAAGSPELSGIWLEPSPEGEPSNFQTAADLLNNPFAPGAAAFLNFFPTAPNVEDPAAFMSALTPDVIQYLTENEDEFVENLSPIVLEMFAPETLTFMLESYPDAFEPDLAERLTGIALGDIEVFIPEASITRTDGNPSVLVSVFKNGDANTVLVAHDAFDALDEFTAANEGVSVDLVFEQATFIEDSIAGVSREGALGGVFAVIVILVFLSGRIGKKYQVSWQATLVTAVSIPLSIFTAFLLMAWIPPTVGTWLQGVVQSTGNSTLRFISQLFPTEITLNIMTLSGLTVAIGRVVDDSIVVLENSFRYIQRGDDPKQAIIRGTKEVAIAIFSATVTTMAVFLPLGLVGGIISSFFLPFGLTVAYALVGSFIVSITVVPALTYLLIRKENIPEERETAMQRWYTPALEWALQHRFVTMLIAALIFVSSLFLLGQLPQSFIPGLGEPTVNVTVSLPPGTGMAETNGLVEELETAVRQLDDVETIQAEIGSAGGFESLFGGGVSQNLANLTISVSDALVQDSDLLNGLTNEVRQAASNILGEDNVTVSAASQTGFSGFALIVTGESQAELETLIEDVKTAVGSVDVDEDGVPDIANVSSSVDPTLQGDNVSQTIIRIDGRPAISFSGELETENTLGVTDAAKQAIKELPTLPDNVEVSEGFDSQQQVEGFRSMLTAILYSIGIVYIIMALTFRSLIHPFTILFSLPFALVGAAIALYITNSVLGISAMIGFMMLVGVVVTNGIVLMELVQQLRTKGQSVYDSLVEAGRTRLRPIWMTALTAILALIPLAASSEAGAIIASELARAVMGGLIVSTALTLIVVPVMYSLTDQLWLKIVGLFKRS
jgi:HAE1 family hydrophobic/amphiphilic exporter-1